VGGFAEEARFAVPTGRVKWYEKDKGFGFLTSDEGADVFVHKAALPSGVDELTAGQRVEFGVVDSRKGVQALAVQVLESPPSVSELRRRPAEELHGLIEDMISGATGFRTRRPPRRSRSWCTPSPASSRPDVKLVQDLLDHGVDVTKPPRS